MYPPRGPIVPVNAIEKLPPKLGAAELTRSTFRGSAAVPIAAEAASTLYGTVAGVGAAEGAGGGGVSDVGAAEGAGGGGVSEPESGVP